MTVTSFRVKYYMQKKKRKRKRKIVMMIMIPVRRPSNIS